MKFSVVLFIEKNSDYCFEKVFDKKSSFELSLNWAKKIPDSSVVVISPSEKKDELMDFKKDVDFEFFDELSVFNLLSLIKNHCEKNNSDSVIFAMSACPFLSEDFTLQMIQNHVEYKAEYSFSEGFPYGITPVIIDKGTLGILCAFCGENGKDFQKGKQKASKDSIQKLIESDINSFDVETFLSDIDYRELRFSFICDKKENFILCKNLYEECKNNLCTKNILCVAQNFSGCYKTVPGFYEIQVCSKYNGKSLYQPKLNFNSKEFMDFSDFCILIDKIANFSEKAVVNLSFFGEPLNNPEILKFIQKVLNYDGLSVFLETDAININEKFCEELKSICENSALRTSGYEKIMIAVRLDSVTEEKYFQINQNGKKLQEIIQNLTILSKYFSDSIYPQFTRMNINEDELESFYRFWSDKNSISGGKVIIQKYDDFAGFLSDERPCDLSPLERNVCWHLRRDFCVLSDGKVLRCKECILDSEMEKYFDGNAFTQNLEEIWTLRDQQIKDQIACRYCKKCEKCNEYYTFNF